MKKIFIILFCFFTFLTAYSSSAQNNNNESLFDSGLILYRNQNYEQAKIKFLTMVANSRNNPYITAGYLMLAKTYEKLDNYLDAQTYATGLINQYPNSKYIADAYYLLATISLKKNQYLETLDQVIYTIEHSKTESLTKSAFALAHTVIANGLQPEQINRLAENHTTRESKQLVQFLSARSLYGQGKKKAGDKLVNELLQNTGEGYISRAARQMQNMPIEKLAFSVRIAIVLPFSGYFDEEAKDFLRGMAYAIKKREQTLPKIDLIIRDTKGNAVETVKSGLSLLNERVSIIIGELTGTHSATLAGLSSQKNIPLIVPVSTDNGITEIGPNIFQANGDLESRATGLATYAINELKMKTFCTLAPADDYGYSMTDAFSTTIDQLGGKIIAQQWYYQGTQDLQRQFLAIREAGFKHTIRDSIQDLNMQITNSRMDSIHEAINRQARQESEEGDGVVKATDIPLTSIDGFFFPIYSEDLAFIAPQLALYNIKARPLGGSYWLDEETLRAQRRYINNVVFVTGNYIPEYDPEYKTFVNDFRKVTSATPRKMSIYGYNVMNLLISAIASGEIDKHSLVEYMKNIKNFPVFGGKITFDPKNRVNQSYLLLQFNDGNIIKLN